MSDPAGEAIPQTDPRAGYLERREAIDRAVAEALAGGRYILGERVEAFERAFAAYCGAGHAIGVASGTDALVLALRALGAGPGTGVVTVSHTAVATVAAIELAGATPVLVDVEPATMTMCPADLAAVLKRPPLPLAAIAPVHLYGRPAAMAAILALAADHGLPVVEDASQAHGAVSGGRRVGSLGRAAAFSLYPTKNLGALGDAGVIVTGDADLARELKALRQYGWTTPQVSGRPGMNSRLDELQAAILMVGLAALDADNDRRRAVAAVYDAGLKAAPVGLPAPVPAGDLHVFHQYVVTLDGRDGARERLKAAGVATGLHYPLPVHCQPAYAGRLPMGPARLAATDALSPRILSLPMFPQLGAARAARVVAALSAALAEG